RRRRVPRRLTAAVRCALPLARPPRQSVRRRRPRTDGLFLRRRRCEPARFAGTSMPTARTIRLVRNYRSSQAIVTTANSLLRHTAKSALTLRTDNPVGQQPNMVEYPTDEAEATGVVNAISAEIRAGRRPRNIAVLFRTNGQSPAYEQ